MNQPVIAVFAGGVSSERDVSLGSGKACAEALARSFPTKLYTIEKEALPEGFNPKHEVVFSTLHGTFGEDGGMQTLLDAAGACYAGCDAASSAFTMDKSRTKAAAAARGVHAASGMMFTAAQKPSTSQVVAQLGDQLVMKPNDQGSSVGLSLIANRTELENALAVVTSGNWLIEQRLMGRECSVGVLNGKAMGIVELRPKSGVYDYTSKYTKGMTEYFSPAPFTAEVTTSIQQAGETVFAACGCRDYARVDFIISSGGDVFLLEINTLPGMKETSLLPMSARCVGLDFAALVKELVTPAIRRFSTSLSGSSVHTQ